jgi:hypothetical protein
MPILKHVAPRARRTLPRQFGEELPQPGFLKSRIYAQGWNAARKGFTVSRNPYHAGSDQALWLEGYHARAI